MILEGRDPAYYIAFVNSWVPGLRATVSRPRSARDDNTSHQKRIALTLDAKLAGRAVAADEMNIIAQGK